MIWLPRAKRLADDLSPKERVLIGSLENCGLVECGPEESDAWANFIMERATFENDSPFKFILPRNDRVNVALLGSYGVHNRIKNYDVKSNLREAIEAKINSSPGHKCVLAFNSTNTNYSFKTRRFSYEQLEVLHKATYAGVFLVASAAPDMLFIFEEDAPACFVSCATESDFITSFVGSSKAKEIFSTNAMDWLITGSPGEIKFLELVLSHTT